MVRLEKLESTFRGSRFPVFPNATEGNKKITIESTTALDIIQYYPKNPDYLYPELEPFVEPLKGNLKVVFMDNLHECVTLGLECLQISHSTTVGTYKELNRLATKIKRSIVVLFNKEWVLFPSGTHIPLILHAVGSVGALEWGLVFKSGRGSPMVAGDVDPRDNYRMVSRLPAFKPTVPKTPEEYKKEEEKPPSSSTDDYNYNRKSIRESTPKTVLDGAVLDSIVARRPLSVTHSIPSTTGVNDVYDAVYDVDKPKSSKPKSDPIINVANNNVLDNIINSW